MINKLKKIVSWASLKYIKPNTIVGVGSGSTISYFIDALSSIKTQIKGAVSSSKETSNKMKKLGINVIELNNVEFLDVYIDSADEINYKMQMIKGKGGALTQEKIIASAAQNFICIADYTKLVNTLGNRNIPLPIEVIPMAQKIVMKKIKFIIGGLPIYRKGIITDNGNIIIDIYNLTITNANFIEEKINNISGVVTVGIFAHRKADVAIIAHKDGNIKIMYN
ncbi:MAG: ribose-5-phosphate isomerase RpiA [Enterobacterales bacterium]